MCSAISKRKIVPPSHLKDFVTPDTKRRKRPRQVEMTAPAKHLSSFCDAMVVKQEPVEDNADLTPDPAFEYVTVKQETTEWEVPDVQDSTQDPLNICKEECSPSEDLPVCSTSNIEKQEDVEDEEKTLSADDGGKLELPDDQDSTQDPLNICKEECSPSEDLLMCSSSNIEKQEHVEDEEKTLTADDGRECSSSEDFLEASACGTGKSGDEEGSEDEEDEEDVRKNDFKGLRNGVESTSNCGESESTLPFGVEDSNDDDDEDSGSLLTQFCAAVYSNEVKCTTKKEAFCGNKSRPSGLLHTCATCKRTFAELQDLNEHKQMDTCGRVYSCSVCHKTFTTRSNVTRHYRVHTGERPFSCSVCNKSFTERGTLKQHMQMHTGQRRYSCDVCNKMFGFRTALKQHLWLHTNERPYSCEVCHKRFRSNSNLKEHSRSHTRERPYSCDICQKTFLYNSNFKRHLLSHTRQ